MLLTLIIGETGSGKSVVARDFVRKSRACCVYDVQGEYGLPPWPQNKQKFCIYPRNGGIQKFVQICGSTTGFTHIVEESTGVFRDRLSQDFINIILSKRHDKNNYIVVSHLLNKVPTDLVGFADVIILFRTGDLRKNIKSKYPELLPHFDALQKSNKKIQVQGSEAWNTKNPGKPVFINEHVIIKKSNLANEML